MPALPAIGQGVGDEDIAAGRVAALAFNPGGGPIAAAAGVHLTGLKIIRTGRAHLAIGLNFGLKLYI